jgi:hypothetical protein
MCDGPPLHAEKDDALCARGEMWRLQCERRSSGASGQSLESEPAEAAETVFNKSRRVSIRGVTSQHS